MNVVEELVEDLRRHSFEIGPIRPPSEGGSHSLLIRATRNCPWSKCTFCYGTFYNRGRFEKRGVEEIKRDIDEARAIYEIIEKLADKLKGMDWVYRVIYSFGMENLQSVITVFNWLLSGGRSAFLQDADSLIMKSSKLAEVISYLSKTFPSIERITSYARAKTLYKKSKEELRILREAGLKRLHVGLESGDDMVLRYVNKGVTAEEHVIAGIKAKEAGFELSMYVMPGLGGRQRWERHAINTAKVLNEIDPDFIRMRPLVPRPNTPLFEDYKKGKFILTSPRERLREIKVLIENLEVTGRVCFDHFMNSWYKEDGEPLFKMDYEGYKFPEEKEKVLKLIEEGLSIDDSFHIHPKDMIHLQL
ncbi:MAG: radical SAM protein [Candidatus Methanospirareceae archaeon]